MRFFVLFFMVFLCPLAAEEEPKIQQLPAEVHDDAVPSLVNLTALPSAVVNGTVNVISGDFVECNQDDIVSGPDPYILGHSYASSSLREGNLGAGWNFLHHHLLEVYQPRRIEYVKKDGLDHIPYLYPFEMTSAYRQIHDMPPIFKEEVNHEQHSKLSLFSHPLDFCKNDWTTKGADGDDPIFLSLYDPTGGRLLFQTDYDMDEKEKCMRHFKLVTKNSGVTNITHGIMSGQTNVKNIRVKWIKHGDKFHVTLGDGTLRIYERQWWRKEMKHKRPRHAAYYRDYHLKKEFLPNGNIRKYFYNKKFEVTAVETYSKGEKQKLSWVWFEQKSTGAFSKQPSLLVKTSDERSHTYYFKRLQGSYMKGVYAVSNINRLGKAVERFKYSQNKQGKKRLIEKVSEDGSWIKTKYYKSGRVKEQSAPIGPNGSEVVTHRYFYHKEKDGSGRCTVLDAYNNINRYYWDRDKRLTGISRFDSNDTLMMREEFIWSENDSYNEGNLRAHIVKDENDQQRFVRKFNYDGRGNLLEDVLLARITKNAGEINFKKDLTHSETCDKIRTRYSYSDDRFNLKMSECDPQNNYTYYEYYPGTNLLKAKFICEKEQIKKREFFVYDDAAIMTEHIVDDGSSRDKENFEGVTERHMTWITPRREFPHYGEPQEIYEFYFDLNTKERVFIKKIVRQYNKSGLVEREEHCDRIGNSIFYEYAYDDAGRLISTTDPLGNTKTLTYDSKTARLVEKKEIEGVHSSYLYNAMGQVIKETEEYKDGLQLTTEYEYDLLGRKTAVIDPQGNITRYAFDALNRVTSITYPNVYDHLGNAISPQKNYTYSTLGAEVCETDELGLVTKTSYNAIGKITDCKTPDGALKRYYYDVKGNMVSEIAPNNTITEISYDNFGRSILEQKTHKGQILSQNKREYNSFHLLKEIGASGETIVYNYGEDGLLRSSTRDGRATLYSYDSAQRLAEERTELDRGFIAKSYIYDQLDRLEHEKLFDHASDMRTYKSYKYDSEGNQAAIIQNIAAQEAVTSMQYRPHGLLDKHTDPEGNVTLFMYDFNAVNSHGQRVLCKKTVDARGCTLEELFDARGNLSVVSRFDPMNQLIAKKEHFYDAANNLVRIHESAISQSGIKNITTLFEYINKHLTAITEALNTPEEKTTRYRYNEFGELEAVIHANGTILTHRYDALGRLEKFYSNDFSIDYTYCYDASDRVVKVDNGATGKSTIRIYNSFGEVTSETLETDLTVTYDYDKAGRIQEVILPDASKIGYEHSAFLDSIKRINTAGEVSYAHKIVDRDAAGLTQRVELPGKAGTVQFNHNKLGLNTHIDHKAFEQNAQKFDSVGNLLDLHTKDPQGVFDRAFNYDFLSQLTSENDHTYSYDSLYNRLEHNGNANEVNCLHSVLSDGDRTFSYDKRGNRTLMRKGNKETVYTYDALDRLIEVRSEDSCYTYSYDAFNRRLSKKNGPDEQKYIYAFDNEIGAVDANNAITELRILGEGLGAEIGASVALELNNKVYVPLHDRQGNIALLLDLDGNVKETYRYDAFGNETIQDKPISPWRFSSKRTDPETGLIYFGRRYYDSSLGKWLTQDPLGLKEGPNLYAYLLNGPLTRFDEYGLYVEDAHDRPNNAARVVYTASFGMLSERNTADFFARDRSDSSRVDQSLFAASWNKNIYLFPSAPDEPEEGIDWGKHFNLALNSLDDALLAADIAGMAMIVYAPGSSKLSGIALKTFSWVGKRFTSYLRSFVPKAVSPRITSQSARVFNTAVKGARQTTDFVWPKVNINGKLVEGWVDVGSTLDRINKGIKHSHHHDGKIWRNKGNPLPVQNRGYYREYVIETPGSQTVGPQRLILGQGGEVYYTGDHYINFTRVN